MDIQADSDVLFLAALLVNLSIGSWLFANRRGNGVKYFTLTAILTIVAMTAFGGMKHRVVTGRLESARDRIVAIGVTEMSDTRAAGLAVYPRLAEEYNRVLRDLSAEYADPSAGRRLDMLTERIGDFEVARHVGRDYTASMTDEAWRDLPLNIVDPKAVRPDTDVRR